MTPEREKRITEVAQNRQVDTCVILENVHDIHNIGAVLRTCDATGIPNVHIVYTDPRLNFKRVRSNAKPASGALKWLNVSYHESVESCFKAIADTYQQIVVSSLSGQPAPLYSLNLTVPTAFIFGNEHQGVSKDFLNLAQRTFVIPMYGMVQSLNISVACAVTLYEMLRQRELSSLYPHPDASRGLAKTTLQSR